jgi:hypothetical protein
LLRIENVDVNFKEEQELKFAVTIESERKAEKNIRHVSGFAQQLTEEVSCWDYGNGLHNFYIGFVSIKTRLGYENWYKERKPRFKKTSKITQQKPLQKNLWVISGSGSLPIV